jgi:hypothetical protein
MDETGLCHITVGMGVIAVLFSMPTKVAKHTPSQEFAMVGKVALLIVLVALICDAVIVGYPSLAAQIACLP